MDETAEILFERRGAIGLVTLSRPKALNALTLGMIRAFQPVLDAWAEDPGVGAVVVRGAGEKAFCAGGDVRAVWQAGKAGDEGGLTRDFFREEYILNRTVFRFPKPYIALIDGITMGGGVGLSVHGMIRVAGDRTLVAMPETAIGLFPDVGGSYFLPRLPGKAGLYLALTGHRVRAADCRYLGIATHYVPTDRQEELLQALCEAEFPGDGGSGAEAAVNRFVVHAGGSEMHRRQALIDRLFCGESVEAIVSALEAAAAKGEAEGDAGWAAEQVDILHKRSPTSMKVAFEQLRRGANLTFEDCMTMEYRLSQAAMAGHNFYEGIRAVLVDKDHAPAWRPASLAEVDRALVESHFKPLGERDLTF
ncbi:3-hydroxyisobutyryl-CoA hydrolase [Tistlia consotensis]|uniref:3-hydroxyisobutyryl-CoA hydrolase n=1 Tax=Tistlia consotensis USBA 355 TaxID=560819 RepID=A0A1Y6C9K6_9PROT|nr:enoyl-CoA hydratase/isomerase family protein [Tistlia consotensis]SMF44211.1 3-hydroxyisobutyryl-CoA hydrolase [Tistlia consotensis USBA 355]SNR43152.1 3-hydroxyisobutyryl-CoA hydrolase [Tistlia consotensis]